MKKLVLGITLVSVFALIIPTTVRADNEPCHLWTLRCGCDGSTHLVVVCDDQDMDEWRSILCDCPLND